MSGGWTVVDSATNKSLPIQGTSNSGARVPYFAPAPGQQDPVGKMRVSTPQALIDTDFEYGTQPTKWESIALQNNRQSVYYIAQQPLAVTAITGTATTDQITITTTSTIPSGVPIFIQNSTNSTINGWGWVTTGGTGVITVNLAPGTSTTTNAAAYYNPSLTYVYAGYFYSGAGIQVAASGAVVVTSATVITVNTVNPHGLVKGNFIYIANTTGGTNVNGAFVVATTPTANSFTVTASGASGASISTTAGVVNIFARPSGFVEPRSFDGGVAFSAGGAVVNQQLIRQTRRYFRYQSGKGLQFSTGSCLRPALFVTSITGTGTTATVTSRYQHNLAVGAKISVFGADQGVYNGNFVVASVPTPTTLTYTTQIPITTATATGVAIRVSPTNWYGAANRVGMFDLQNGMFFEFDGQTLYAVLRNSINQANGTVSVTNGSNIVTGVAGSGTQFTTQCLPGSYVVIRGQSYRVVSVQDDSTMYVSPEYRGTTITGAIVSLTLETRIPQSKWQDPADGTGPSGYNLDLTRMQMWYIDYSWYGAGVIRYGFRATNGQITYVTQIQNNNVQFEAYMRSGNMGAHYESNGIAPMSIITASLSNSTTTLTAAIDDFVTTIPVASTGVLNTTGVIKIDSELIYYSGISGNNLIGAVRGYGGTVAAVHANGVTVTPSSLDILDAFKFPPAGTVKVQASGISGVIEYIAYTGNDGSILYGLTRTQTGGQAAPQSFSYSATAPVSVELVSPDTVPSLSHWGSSVIMDGQFNDDKSLIFNYGTDLLTTTTSTTALTPVLAIRIGPSVDNGQIGLLGQKEIINRMQLQLVELGIVTSGPVLVNLVLNGVTTGTFSGTFTSPVTKATGAYTSSLAQVAQNTTNSVTVIGGESVAAAFTNTNGQTTLDLTQVRDLGNSILGGGTSNTMPTAQAGFYPDGPDILYVCVTPLTATAVTVYSRLSWKEAQA
jgi:hypothetical protein